MQRSEDIIMSLLRAINDDERFVGGGGGVGSW
jgi:hypothetical protein